MRTDEEEMLILCRKLYQAKVDAAKCIFFYAFEKEAVRSDYRIYLLDTSKNRKKALKESLQTVEDCYQALKTKAEECGMPWNKSDVDRALQVAVSVYGDRPQDEFFKGLVLNGTYFQKDVFGIYEGKRPPAGAPPAAIFPDTLLPATHIQSLALEKFEKSIELYLLCRKINKDEYFGRLSSFFGGSSKTDKVNAAEKLLAYNPNSDEPIQLTYKELEALKKGRLGDLAKDIMDNLEKKQKINITDLGEVSKIVIDKLKKGEELDITDLGPKFQK